MSDIKMFDGGVTSAKGFKAFGLRAGLKPGKTNKDMAMVYSEKPCTLAGTFTLNEVKAAPVKWDKKIVEECGSAQAVVVNTANANACTGTEGYNNAQKMAELTGKLLGLPKESVLVASTGVIGQQLNMDVITEGIKAFEGKLSDSREAATLAAEAIMTTDTHKKETAVTFEIGGQTVTLGGMVKGSGMIHPNMGTMLCFFTTDADIDRALLQEALKANVDVTFNMVSVDGDTSTNDTVVVLANGMSGAKKITMKDADYNTFKEALYQVCLTLCKQVAGDGEGCTKLIESHITGASDYENAKILAKSIITSSLLKAAVYGKDANWGRILCAMGYSGAKFDTERVRVSFKSDAGEITVCDNGVATDFDEEKATAILSGDVVIVDVELTDGNGEATAWGCDLTHEYVSINADYRS